MQSVKFPIDHFGIVSAPLFAALLNQSGDKRKRKSAFNDVVRTAKAYKLIPKNSEVGTISLGVDMAGQISYYIDYEVKGLQEPAKDERGMPIITAQTKTLRELHDKVIRGEPALIGGALGDAATTIEQLLAEVLKLESHIMDVYNAQEVSAAKVK